MRRIKATASVGKVNMPAPLSREFASVVALLVVGAWVAYSFAQEALLNHRLNEQAGELRQRNAAIAAQNAAYERDLITATSASATDEEARQYGYARPDEKVYVVNQVAPPPATAAPARAKAATSNTGGGPLQSLWRWIAELWHR
jgi:cell division protein FtsB